MYGGLYEIGTASLGDGGSPADNTVITIEDALLSSNVVVEDTFEYAGRRVTIVEVIDDEHIRIPYEWPDSPFSEVEGGDWVIRQDSPRRNPTIAQARTLRDQYERLRIFDRSKPLLGIVEFGVNTPPEDYAVDDALVIGDSPTGEFVGRTNMIARRTEENSWFYLSPEFGWHVIAEIDPLGVKAVRTWDGDMWNPTAGLAAGITYEGEWDNTAEYAGGDVVKHNEKYWIATQESINQEPSNVSAYWDEFSIPGDHGGIPIALEFDSDTSSSEPSSGGVKLNSATAGSVSVIRISKTDLYGGNRAAEIEWINSSNVSNQKGWIRLQKIGAVEDFRAIVMSVTDAGTSYNLTVSSPTAPNGLFTDGDPVLFYFAWRGERGQQGEQGIQGLRGLPGGAVSIPLAVDANSTANSDPGNGVVRFNSATQNLSTALYVDLLSSAGASLQSLLDSIASASTSAVKVAGQIFDAAGAGKFIAFDVTAVATPAGYRALTITVLGASTPSPFSHGEAVYLSWVEKGDKGDTGTIAVGTVTTKDAGESAEVTNSGTSTAAVFDFALPRGDRGLPLQPWRVVNTIDQRDQFDALSPVLDDGNQRSVLVLSDATAGGISSLYYLLEAADDPNPAVWSERTDPAGITADQLALTLTEQPDPVAMAMIFS